MVSDFCLKSITTLLTSPKAGITNLNVAKNPFTDKGAAVFLKAVLNNNTLQNLNIGGLRLTKESIAKIEELRATKSSLSIVE